MPYTIYHNPRCSKSRQTLALLEQAGVEIHIVEYLKSAPTAATLIEIGRLLGEPLENLLRKKEAEFREATDLPPLDDEAALAAWLSKHPKVLERPIVIDAEHRRAVVGRPPENVNVLLGS